MTKEERIEVNLKNGYTEVEVCSPDFGQFIGIIINTRKDTDGSTIYVILGADDFHCEVSLNEIELIGDEDE